MTPVPGLTDPSYKIMTMGKNVMSINEQLRKRGFHLTNTPAEAQLVVCYGGDGSLFTAEHEFPGIPKFPIRDAETAPLCPKHTIDKQLTLLARNALASAQLPKLSCRVENKCDDKMFGINDIFLHNSNPATAMRYRVYINDEMYAREVVGDGVGVSTVHGSTGYYKSITHSVFRTGIGLAFNNSTELINHLVLPWQAVIKIEVLRGPALIVADNYLFKDVVAEGQLVELYLRRGILGDCRTIGLDIFMCPECRRLRHTLRDSSRFMGGMAT